MIFYLSHSDGLPILQTQLSDSQGYVDITSGTPMFYYRLRSLASGSGVYSGQGAIVGNGTSGVVSYTWDTGSPVGPGVYSAYWKVTFPTNKTMTFPNDGGKILFQVSPSL